MQGRICTLLLYVFVPLYVVGSYRTTCTRTMLLLGYLVLGNGLALTY